MIWHFRTSIFLHINLGNYSFSKILLACETLQCAPPLCVCRLWKFILSVLLCSTWPLSHVWLFVTPWTVARQAPLSMENLQARILKWAACPMRGDLPNPGTEAGCPALQVEPLPFETAGKPKNTGVGSLSFSRESFPPRNRKRVLSTVSSFFTNRVTREALIVFVLSAILVHNESKIIWV